MTTLEEKLNKKSVEQQYIAHQLKKVTRKVKNCLASEIMEQLRKVGSLIISLIILNSNKEI